MSRGKTVTLYLIDGLPNGKIRAKLSGWDGIAYKIPRRMLSDCEELDNFNNSGIYFLFGNGAVYIGQAEIRKTGKGIHQRIIDHENDKYKELWDEVVIFTTKDNSLGRTDLSYLENRFYNKAIESERYSVLNSNEPSIGNVTEEKEDELEDFIDFSEIIIGALGYRVFEKKLVANSIFNKNDAENRMIDIPPLPTNFDKIGTYVRTAMKNLSESGYIFSNEDIDNMCTSDWSKKHFSTKHPFMKRYIDETTNNKDSNNKYGRFWSEIFTFGEAKVLISKEWFHNQLMLFENWYNSLH